MNKELDLEKSKKVLLNESNQTLQQLFYLKQAVQKDFEILGFLSNEVFDSVLHYSLQNQMDKLEKIKAFSPKALLTDLSGCYYRIYHPNSEIQTKIKLNILNSFPFIGIQVSSIVMSLHEPENYAYLDPIVWQQLFEDEKKSFSLDDYLTYNEKIKELALQSSCDMLETVFLIQQSSKELC